MCRSKLCDLLKLTDGNFVHDTLSKCHPTVFGLATRVPITNGTTIAGLCHNLSILIFRL